MEASGPSASADAVLGRRQLLHMGAAAAGVLAGGVVLAGCGSASPGGKAAGSATTPSPSSSSSSSAGSTAPTSTSATLSGAFYAPAMTGRGIAPTSASSLVTTGSGGSVTVIGDGGDMENPSDNLVFAGTQCLADATSLVCRVSALSNLNCPYLYPWSRAGIIARGDLSSEAPMVAVAVTGGYGLEAMYRSTAHQSTFGHYGSGANTYTNVTVTTVKGIPQTNATGTANVLLKPVWLKLERSGTLWTPYYSLDGTTFTPVGNGPDGHGVSVEMNGCWVGLYVCAVNVVFYNDKELTGATKGQVRATFDHLNFPVHTFEQVGQAQGLAPAPVAPSSTASSSSGYGG
jgi:hypothetical protein